MPDRTCETCGTSFWQRQGRPARFCPDHRRYGAEHRALRESTKDSSYGTACARCGQELEPGQEIHLDHADDGRGWIGWSHGSCNVSAGAAHGNRLRADAYRAAAGKPPGRPGSLVAARERASQRLALQRFPVPEHLPPGPHENPCRCRETFATMGTWPSRCW